MKQVKSNPISLVNIIKNLLILLPFVIVIVFPNSLLKLLLFISFVLLFIAYIIYPKLSWLQKKVIVICSLSSFVSIAVLLLGLRFFRNFFLFPQVLDNKIVGYSQYFGYPFYFDTLYLNIIIFIPAIILILLYFRKIKK
jgi:multisubunit Na+/H+ antiporter MnhB subunit